MNIPSFKNRPVEDIVDCDRPFDSAWHIWQSLSWLDHAKRHTCISALQYSALELRCGIEHLWFDIIVTAGGGQLDQTEYSRCKGDSTKMYKVLERLFPDHQKLVRFTNLSGSHDHAQPQAIEWDIKRLKRLHGESSQLLHFFGVPTETMESSEWLLGRINLLDDGAGYIWHNITTGRTGQLSVTSMPPEVRDAWEGFRVGELDADAVRIRLSLAQPILRTRKRFE